MFAGGRSWSLGQDELHVQSTMIRWEHAATWMSCLRRDDYPCVPLPPEGEGWELVTVITWETTNGGIVYWKRRVRAVR